MKRVLKCAGLLACAMMMSGCSAVITSALANAGTDEATLRKSTAQYFSVSQGSVQVSDIRNGAFGASYKARVRGVRYNCGVTYGAVECKRPG